MLFNNTKDSAVVTIIVNRRLFKVNQNLSLLDAAKFVGIFIPRFCYHESLSISGNCRMCLVEIENTIEVKEKQPNKPILTASCLTLVASNLDVRTDTPFVKKARENVVEFLLLNHPLDCPICDQAGECDLQDQSKNFGVDFTRYFIKKKVVEDKYCNSFIKMVMTRCIHCTRCVRFFSELSESPFFGTLSRGGKMEIGTYVSEFSLSEVSGNVIDLCPVGALTLTYQSYKGRP